MQQGLFRCDIVHFAYPSPWHLSLGLTLLIYRCLKQVLIIMVAEDTLTALITDFEWDINIWGIMQEVRNILSSLFLLLLTINISSYIQ